MSTDVDSPDESETLRINRRLLLKGAVAAGVGAAVYASPVVSVVPAYGAVASLVSFTTQSRVVCVWFSPNQQNYGQWHHNETGYTDVANNYNPFSGVMGGAASWACYPPSMRVGVLVGTQIRYVTFVGTPDDTLWNLSGTDICDGQGYPAYTLVNGTTPWSGGGVRITVEDPDGSGPNACEMVVTGTALSPAGAVLNLGPYCNPQSNDCSDTNATGPPATWAQGSSLTPIGGAGCTFLAQTRIFADGATTINSTTVTSAKAAGFTTADVGRSISGPGIPAGATITAVTNATTVTISAAATATGSKLTITVAVPGETASCATTSGSQPNGNVGAGVFKGTAYYHTGQTGRGDGNRCKFALLFQVRCRF